MRILVVDDSEDILDLTVGALESAGYVDVLTAGSASEAISLLEIGNNADAPPEVDLILLDIVMPEVDGIEACARIRRDPRYADIPVIMVTALADMDSLANAFVAGANDYVTKPVNRIELVARVRAALKLRAELERRQERERELLSFLSTWGDRRATGWIDEATGLFTGEVAEAYLTAATSNDDGGLVTIFALTLDRFDLYRAAAGENVARRALARVARAIALLPSAVGVVAGAYRNGLIVLIAPDTEGRAARQFADSLCAAVERLRIPNPESIVSDHLTATVATVTGRVHRGADRVHLLTHAIAAAQSTATPGGNRVLAVSV